MPSIRSISAMVLVLVCLTSTASVYAQGNTNWVRSSSNPVLSPGETGWDSWQIMIPRLLYDGSTYKMWYTGLNTTGNPMIGYASSADGVTWTKHGNPVLVTGSGGEWDSSSAHAGFVFKNESAYMMWYHGSRKSSDGTAVDGIGLATSTDGISWTKFPANPVITQTAIDGGYLDYPWVLMVGDRFDMYYACQASQSDAYAKICLADSTDGIHWSKRSTPVFMGSGREGDWDASNVYSPNVLYDGHVYGMWYSACNCAKSGITIYQIGFATSPDGIKWTRASKSPILGPSSNGAWDSSDSVDNQGIVQVDGGFRLYYSADQGPLDKDGAPKSYKIGFAESPVGFAIPEFPNYGVLVMVALLLLGFTVSRRAPKKLRRA